MADLTVRDHGEEIAVAIVQALSRQDGDQALQLCASLSPLLGDRAPLRARHAAWSAQAHHLRGDLRVVRGLFPSQEEESGKTKWREMRKN